VITPKLDRMFRSALNALGNQQPIALTHRKLVALAGLSETWRSLAGERIGSFAIFTTKPNDLSDQLHKVSARRRAKGSEMCTPGKVRNMRVEYTSRLKTRFGRRHLRLYPAPAVAPRGRLMKGMKRDLYGNGLR
jgi:hypothetical protein